MNNNKNLNKTNKKKNLPAILYVEGQDQFRGWFNSSLVTSVILTNNPPYQQVLSHGFVVDEKGQKMSKSLGNVIDPEELLTKYGADILRLWVVSSDFTKEIKVSNSILENVQESYQKIRNTLRFLLGNLTHLPTELKSEKDLESNLNLVDYYILSQLEKLIEESEKNYQKYNFAPIYSSLLNFCINDLSSFYFEISKDSLYCDSISSLRRQQIITTLYYLLQGTLKIITPILPYLAEEIYQNIPFQFGFKNQESVYLINYSLNFNFLSNIKEELKLITDYFLPLRQDIFQSLERARQENIIISNQQANLEIYLKPEKSINYSKLNLVELLLVAEIKIKEIKDKDMWEKGTCFIKLTKTHQERCSRCRNWRELISENCFRCKKVFIN